MTKITRNAGVFVSLLLIAGALSTVNAQDLSSAIRLTHSERFDAAAAAYQKLISQDPKNGDLYFYYGVNFIDRYFADTLFSSLTVMADSANKVFERGVSVDPNNPICYVGQGEVQLLKNRPQEAATFMDKAISLLPTKKNKIQMSADKQAVIWIKMADAYVNANVPDTGRIFSYLREASRLDSKNPELYLVKGDAYIDFLNDGSNAISNYNMAAALNPTSPNAKLKIGLLWLKAKQYQMALNYYMEVIKIDSNFAPAYRALGFLLSKAGRNADAKKYFDKYLNLSGDISARMQYINTLINLQDYYEAINQAQLILAKDTTNNDLNRALAYSYFETGQFDQGLVYARKFFRRADLTKVRSTDYAYLGKLLVKNKFDRQAARAFTFAYETDTTKPDFLSDAAMCYVRLKSYDTAIQIFDRKINLKIATPMDYYNLGKVYYNVPDYKMSDSILAIFNQQQPTYVPGFVWRARASSQLDPDSKQGLAKPVYEQILAITQSDTAKYVKDRSEALYYLAYYYFLQYNQTKDKTYGIQSMDYCQRIIAIDPNDEKAQKAQQIIDVLKKVIK